MVILNTQPAADAADLRCSQMFLDMLRVIGPQTSNELIARLQLDFDNTAQALRACANDPLDWHGLRAQSHILIGLAATVGYDDLAQIAQTINASAHVTRPDAGRAAGLIQTASAAIGAAIPALGQLVTQA